MTKLANSNDLSINIDAIRAAASNAAKVQDVAFEVPGVNPRDLSIEDKIYGIVLQPIENKKTSPDTTMYVAIEPILVDTLSNKAKEGYITVNGTIDIPKESGRLTKLENSFFTNEADARAICRGITEIELERAIDREAAEKKNRDFLQKQLNEDRF